MDRQHPEYHECDAEALLAANGRSFYWASRLLGRQMAGNAARLYAFCRVLDDMADGDIEDGAQQLAIIQHQLSQLIDNRKYHPLEPNLQAFMVLADAADIPLQPVMHLMDGLVADQQQVALQSEDELVHYAYHVAGCHNRTAYKFAIDMGIAMQLTNIARDVLEDAQLGRRYLPASWVNNMSAEQILACAEGSDNDGQEIIRQAILRLLMLADRYYQSGEAGLGFLPFRARLAISVAGRVYRKIGIRLKRNGVNWHQGRTITGKTEKLVASLGALAPLLRAGTSYRHNAHLHISLKQYLGAGYPQ
jgi:phytoene synthase